MYVEMVRDLHYYNDWAMARVLECARNVSMEQFTADNADLPWGSIRNQLAHVLDVHRRWLNWCDGSLSGDEAYRLNLDHEDFPDVASLEAFWAEIQAQTHRFLERMTPEDLTRNLEYGSSNFTFAVPVGKVMTHIVLHSTQHRTEAAMELTRLGQSPGDIDYIFYALQQGTETPAS